MQNIPDKDIDRIFKQAADNQKFDVDPEAWESMQKMLEQKASRKVFFKNLKSLVLIGLLLVAGLATYWYLQQGFDNGNHSLDQDESSINLDISTDEDAISKNQLSNVPIDPSQNLKESLEKPANSQNIQITASNSQTSILTTDKTINKKPIYNEFAKNQNEKISLPTFVPRKKPGNQNLGYHDPTKISKKSYLAPEKSKRNKLSIGIVASPDFSGLGFSSFSKTGNNVGITLEYQINSRFSLQTGLIHSRKIYSVTDEFKPYPGYWQKIPQPDLIDGSCNVIDIPINIRYNIFNSLKSKIFVSTGLSTYLMRTEEYDYIYNDPSRSYPYSKTNENQHLFGIYNLSAGYEHFLHPKWSIQIEPFLKLPISEIGVGNLGLMSAGGFISFRHHLLNNKL